MTKYELTFLLPEEAGLKKITEILSSLSINVIKEEPWGERTLSYTIKKNNTAFFYSYIIEAEGQKIAELKKKLNFEPGILRYLLLISE